jgi:hypothetical protein
MVPNFTTHFWSKGLYICHINNSTETSALSFKPDSGNNFSDFPKNNIPGVRYGDRVEGTIANVGPIELYTSATSSIKTTNNENIIIESQDMFFSLGEAIRPIARIGDNYLQVGLGSTGGSSVSIVVDINGPFDNSIGVEVSRTTTSTSNPFAGEGELGYGIKINNPVVLILIASTANDILTTIIKQNQYSWP